MWLTGSRAQAQKLWRTGLVALRHVGSSRTRARTHVPCIGRQILNHCATREVPTVWFSDVSRELPLWFKRKPQQIRSQCLSFHICEMELMIRPASCYYCEGSVRQYIVWNSPWCIVSTQSVLASRDGLMYTRSMAAHMVSFEGFQESSIYKKNL